MKIYKLFELCPRFEVFVRNLYWRLSILQRLVAKMPKARAAAPKVQGFSAVELLATLRKLGIAEDDVIIVHSSMTELSRSGLGASEVIDELTEKLCPRGTLVCPTFPLYAKEPQGKERLTKDLSGVEFLYDVEKSRPWTGEVGRALMKKPGARRSLHPLNTITAYGAAVEQIFANETIDSLDLPCGPNSTWASLARMNAKVIMLGVDLTHSLTMIHVAEDCYEAEWPVKGWYRNRIFRIRHQGNENVVTVRERHPKWALSYAERRLSRDLYREGVAKRARVGSLDVTVLESKALMDFLNGRKKSAYPYYMTWLSRL